MEKLTVHFSSYLSRGWYRSCGDKYLGILNFDSQWNDSATLSELTFKNRVSYIQDGRTATLQMLHYIHFFQ
jgi:hypothetical protein